MNKLIRIATRSSPLALWQTHFVKKQLLRHDPTLQFELIEITTHADRVLDKALTEIGGKSLFVKELQAALLNNDADIAVHSVKDMSVHDVSGLTLAAICEREDARDVFVSNDYACLADLPLNAVVGTSSPRRQSMLKALRPDLQTTLLRGNVGTRLQKLDAGQYDAIILAAAGLKRLGLGSRIREFLSAKEFIPAIGQGALGIECRSADATMREVISTLDHAPTRICVTAERAVNRKLKGDCYTPIGAHAVLMGDQLQLAAVVADLNGAKVLTTRVQGMAKEAEKIGAQAAEDLLQQGAGELLG